MPSDLVSAIKRSLGPEVAHAAALLTGESSEAARRALESAVPAALAGLIGLASSPSGAMELERWLDTAGVLPAAERPAALFEGGEITQSALAAGQQLLARLFGERLPRVGVLVARAAGVSPTSSLFFLGLGSIAALGAIRREGGGGTDLAALLAAQRASVADAAPPEMARAMGVSSIAGLGAGTRPAVAEPHPRTPLVWVLPIALAAMLVAALATSIKGCAEAGSAKRVGATLPAAVPA
jgi:hypothetical protein